VLAQLPAGAAALAHTPAPAPLLLQEIVAREAAWRRVVSMALQHGVAAPGMTTSLNYFDAYRRARLPANLVQAQRDFFGAWRSRAGPPPWLGWPARRAEPRRAAGPVPAPRPRDSRPSAHPPTHPPPPAGSHTYQRTDKDGWFHTVWDETFGSADSITTSQYNA
jgi:6-phosphogluconate dehydrogenase